MADNLSVDFEKTFASGFCVRGAFEQAIGRFSVLVLFGPSGCGKTTLLRCLAGLEKPTCGKILFGDEIWFDSTSRISLSPQRRGIGYCSQDYALFPHLTVSENIAYRVPLDENLIDQFELSDLKSRYPDHLSGGQQQRVALARSLALRPQLLLLDEPLSALDSGLRESLRTQLRRLLSDFRIPIVLVTHDRTEAIALGDQVVVIDDGLVLQTGPVADVFGSPANSAVAKIVGIETVVEGQVSEVGDGVAMVVVGGCSIWTAMSKDDRVRKGVAVLLCIRGEDVTLQKTTTQPQSSRNHLPATVKWIVPEGPLVRVGIDAGFELTSLITRSAREVLDIGVGDSLFASIKATAIHVIVKG